MYLITAETAVSGRDLSDTTRFITQIEETETMSTNSPDYRQTDSPLHSFPIEQLDDLISPFLVSPQLVVPPQQRINLGKDYDPGYKASHLKKSKAKGKLKEGIKTLAKYQDILYSGFRSYEVQ